MAARSKPTSVAGRGQADDEVELGFVNGVFGVRGEVRLHLHNRETSVLFDGAHPVVLIAPVDGRRFAATLSARPGAGARVLGRLDGVDDPEAARAWMGWRVAIAQAALPALEDDEFWWWQVEGLPVYVGAQRVGTITAVHETPAVELFEIAPEGGGEPLFVAVVDENVVAIDVSGGRVELAASALEEA